MPRPVKERLVKQPPLFTAFKPVGIRRYGLQRILLQLDEFEAIRLADEQGLEHAEAAAEMGISRSTFTRLLDSARKKLAEFIIKGCQLQIEGGTIHFRGNIYKCLECGAIITSSISEEITECPSCSSANLQNLATSYGHGECCREYNEE